MGPIHSRPSVRERRPECPVARVHRQSAVAAAATPFPAARPRLAFPAARPEHKIAALYNTRLKQVIITLQAYFTVQYQQTVNDRIKIQYVYEYKNQIKNKNNFCITRCAFRAGKQAYEFEEIPVEDVIVGEVLAMEEVAEQLAEVRVVRFVLEAQAPAKGQVRCKLVYRKNIFSY